MDNGPEDAEVLWLRNPTRGGGGWTIHAIAQEDSDGDSHTNAAEIAALREENADLKIKEADLRSLNRIEAAGEELRMQKADEERYLEAHGPVAMR